MFYQSFPILIVIALYERRLASRQKMEESKKHTFYNSFPRHLKSMPLIEYLVGSKSTNLYDVIFEVEESRDFNLFHDSDNEDEGVSPLASVSVLPASPLSRLPSRGRTTLLDSHQTPRSPRKRKISSLATLDEVSSNAKVLSLDATTPLSKLFSHSRPVTAIDHESGANLQRMQTLLDQYRDLPIRRLQDDMKEIHVCGYCDIDCLS